MAVQRSLGLALGVFAVAAEPHFPNHPDIQELLKAHYESDGPSSAPCEAVECHKPDKQHQMLLNTQPGVQWMDHGGYCGSWSIQRTAMAKGVWVSQQQVRDHTVAGGGNDEEILETNIDLALTNLKLKADHFQYKSMPTPQANAYRQWLKEKLSAGHPVVWMIMLRGGHYPVYPPLAPYGQYAHIEPVVGIMSDRPLTDKKWYDDDVLVHYTDADTNTYYRTMESLPTTLEGQCNQTDYRGYPCIYEKYGFGWSIEGVQDEHEGLPLSLTVDPWVQEPDTRTGFVPEPLTGTVTVAGLTAGVSYTIYRWDSVATAFDYSQARTVRQFTATSSTEVYTDPTTFQSSSATYYRCLKSAEGSIVV